MIVNRQNLRLKRKRRSSSIKGTIEIPRVVFSKTGKYLTVQAIDDKNHNTIFYYSTKKIKLEPTFCHKNESESRKLGEIFAEGLKEKNILKIVFDRNGYIYHGKIKEFCDSMRRLGIIF